MHKISYLQAVFLSDSGEFVKVFASRRMLLFAAFAAFLAVLAVKSS
jgi:hypothetical protein